MTWLDPQFWSDERDYGKNSIINLITEFKVPLEASGFDEAKVFSEWRSAQTRIKTFYNDVGNAATIWQRMLKYKRMEFPNLLMLVELIMCLSGSNSSVERAFSVLTTLLSDRRLSMKHDTMEEVILIAGNDSLWSDSERAEILNAAVEKYMSKRRILRMEQDPGVAQPMEPMEVVDEDVDQLSEEDELNDDQEEESDDSAASEISVDFEDM